MTKNLRYLFYGIMVLGGIIVGAAVVGAAATNYPVPSLVIVFIVASWAVGKIIQG